MDNNSYAYITLAAPTTTIVSAGKCILAGLTINKTTASGVITIYNGATVATGSIIAVITQPGTLIESQVSINFHDICLNEGLTIVTSGAAQDITVAFRGA